MIPSYDTTMASEAVALLTDMFRSQTNISGMVTALTAEVQLLEDQTATWFSAILLATAEGDMLDKWGSIVGVPRIGRDDSTYRTAILAEISVLRSQGRAEDVIAVAKNIMLSTTGIVDFSYRDYPPAAFVVDDYTGGQPGLYYLEVMSALSRARAAGTDGNYIFFTVPLRFAFSATSSVGSPVVGVSGGFNSVAGAGANQGGYLASGQTF